MYKLRRIFQKLNTRKENINPDSNKLIQESENSSCMDDVFGEMGILMDCRVEGCEVGERRSVPRRLITSLIINCEANSALVTGKSLPVEGCVNEFCGSVDHGRVIKAAADIACLQAITPQEVVVKY